MDTGVPAHPDVSIIIPTFNRLWCLPEAVASCRQSECSIEIIVIDDGSTDGTWEWLLTQTDVVAMRQPNWGKDWAVNKGLAASQGEFVRFLDSDDVLPPNVNDMQIEIARRDSSDVVVAGHLVADQRSGEISRVDWFDCDDFIAQQLGECDSSHYSAYLMRREFVSDIPHRQEFACRDDRLFVIEMALRRPRVSICREPCLVLRHHDRERLQFPKGMRSVVTNWSHFQLFRKMAAILEEQGELSIRRRQAIARALWPVAHWIAYSHPREAAAAAGWIFEINPGFVPPEPGLLGLLYRRLGFRWTERILRFRRNIRAAFHRVTPAETLQQI